MFIEPVSDVERANICTQSYERKTRRTERWRLESDTVKSSFRDVFAGMKGIRPFGDDDNAIPAALRVDDRLAAGRRRSVSGAA